MTEQNACGCACQCGKHDTTAAGVEAPAVTHVLMAVDESGSMGPLAADVRGGFNTFLDDLAADTDVVYRLTVLMFNHTTRMLCPVGVAPADVPRLATKTYRPGGNTALYDAVGKLIVDFENGTALGKDDRVLLVVQTDGEENSSREFTAERVRQMVEDRAGTVPATAGAEVPDPGKRWAAMYLGAGPAAWNAGAAIGMMNVNTAATTHGTASTYTGVTQAAHAYARGASAARTFTVASAAAGVPDQQSTP